MIEISCVIIKLVKNLSKSQECYNLIYMPHVRVPSITNSIIIENCNIRCTVQLTWKVNDTQVFLLGVPISYTHMSGFLHVGASRATHVLRAGRRVLDSYMYCRSACILHVSHRNNVSCTIHCSWQLETSMEVYHICKWLLNLVHQQEFTCTIWAIGRYHNTYTIT